MTQNVVHNVPFTFTVTRKYCQESTVLFMKIDSLCANCKNNLGAHKLIGIH